MKTALKSLLVLIAALFVLSGLRWWVDPAGAAAALGMPLLEGAALSTQVGDLAAFFLTIGLMVLAAVATGERRWVYAPVLLLLLAAMSRTLAWVLHDAALTPDFIAAEIVGAALLWFLAKGACGETA